MSMVSGPHRPAGWVSGNGVRWTAMAQTAQADRTGGGRLDIVGADTKMLLALRSTPDLENFFTWEVP